MPNRSRSHTPAPGCRRTSVRYYNCFSSLFWFAGVSRASHTPHTPLGLQSHVYRWPGIATVRRHTPTRAITNNNDGKHVRSIKHAFAPFPPFKGPHVRSPPETAGPVSTIPGGFIGSWCFFNGGKKKNVGPRGSVVGPQIQWASDGSSF